MFLCLYLQVLVFATITPMQQDSSVNFPVLKELLNFKLKMGTDAIIICVVLPVNCDLSAMTDEEQIRNRSFI